MKNKLYLVLVLVVLAAALGTVAAAEESGLTPQKIIERSDAVRNPDQPFRVKLRLTEYVEGAPRNVVILRVYSKMDRGTGQFKNLVRYQEPPRDLGKAVLMNGTTMWFYDPASKSSVRISPQQRLVGQASEGDVLTVNLAKDYTGKFAGPPGGETLQDADRKTRQCWHLVLTPSNAAAIYGKVEFWVEKGTFRPVKGKFYTDSGRMLKIAYYHNYREQLGATRPGEVIIVDAVNTKLVTTINSSEYAGKEIPDSWYQREFLPHLKAE